MTSDRKIILVTGSNTGIGFATIQAFLEAPDPGQLFTILLTSRSLARAREAVEFLKKDPVTASSFDSGNEVIPVELDLNSEDSWTAVIEKVEKEFGKLDVLVNNAGILLDLDVLQGKLTRRDAFFQSFETNVVSTHFFTEAFMPLLFKSAGPRIVFLTTGLASMATHGDPAYPPNQAPAAGWPKGPASDALSYRVSKSAMNMMIMEWRRILKNDNFKINIVNPDWMATSLGGLDPVEMSKYGAGDPKDAGRFVKSVIEGKRDGDDGKMLDAKGIVPW
ncbi:NAD(P)-binding protein [Meredithblackwellia eburnea MCA 4105]